MTARSLAAAGALLLSATVLLAGCGGDDRAAKPTASKSATYNGQDPSATPTSSSSPGNDTPPSAKPKKQKTATPPLAAATIKPVLRNGKRPRPSIVAKPAAMDGTVKYTDGVSLEITKITHGTVTGQGPGVVEGPTTTLAMKLTNKGEKTVDLDGVVVTTVFGTPGRISSPVYQAKAQDFAGKVKPGKSTTAVYSFMLSEAQGAKVSVHVDFDAVHAAAVFTGSTS